MILIPVAIPVVLLSAAVALDYKISYTLMAVAGGVMGIVLAIIYKATAKK
jgi:hypothetical protein